MKVLPPAARIAVSPAPAPALQGSSWGKTFPGFLFPAPLLWATLKVGCFSLIVKQEQPLLPEPSDAG